MRAEHNEPAVQEALTRRLAARHAGPGVVWVKDGDEVVVWLESLRVQLRRGIVRVRVDLETRETGRAAQDVVIVVAEPAAPPSLLGVSDETARGDSRLAARWGRTLQDAVWGALLDLAGDDATGLAAQDGTLLVHAPERG
jgi:hypothetical protein